MAVTFWAEAGLSNDSQVRDIDAWSYSLQTNLRGALDDEHLFSSSTGTADRGIHRSGSGRAYNDVQSNLTRGSGVTTGQLFYASDTSRLFVFSSSVTTTFVGGPTTPEVNGWRNQGFSAVSAYRDPTIIWATQAGFGETNSSGTTTISLPRTYTNAAFVLTLTPLRNPIGTFASSLGPGIILTAQIDGGGNFHVSSLSDTGGAASRVTFMWMSLGTVTI